jgi:hypothetical protein
MDALGSGIAAFASMIVFNVVTSLYEGHMDKFLLLAIGPQLGIAFCVALVVGLLFYVARKR